MNNFIRLNNMPAPHSDGSERNEIVACSRLLMQEYNGKEGNRLRNNESYKSRLDDVAYNEMNANISERTIMFAAKVAANNLGEDAPENYADFLKQQRKYMRNETFLRVLAGIAEDVIAPTLPYVTSNVLGDLANTATVGIGETYEITIKSNDVFVFQDSSWGATRSVPKNYMYDNVLTANPKPKSCSVKIKWYQFIGNSSGPADLGRYYNALAGGISNKILAMWSAAMIAAASDATKVPAYLRFNGYTTANWISAAKAVSMANGIDRRNLMAFGDLSAISKVLPSGTTQDAALTTLLGDQYFSRGFMGTAAGVPITELTNAYIAGQVNNAAPTAILPTNVIYMAARAGEGYAPITVVYEDSPVLMEITPDRSGDMSIDINMTVSVAALATFATKMAVISNVS